MIGATISNHGTPTQLFNLQSSWFDSIDGEDNRRLPDDKQPSPATTARAKPIFDETGYGVDTYEPTEIAHKQNSTKEKPKYKKSPNNSKVLDEYTTTARRIELLTRPYEPSDFDKAPRAQWIPKASNDNHKRKHSFPALDEARNNQLIVGRNRADTLVQNEWAFDILLEVRDLMDAAAPASAWLEHNGHGAADEHDLGDDSNPGYGVDIKRYAPAHHPEIQTTGIGSAAVLRRALVRFRRQVRIPSLLEVDVPDRRSLACAFNEIEPGLVVSGD